MTVEAFFAGVICGALLLGIAQAVFPTRVELDYRTEVCTLAFTHAETRLDSLEVTVTYDYCEIEPTEHP